ncbi:MAG: hypothetical protein ACREMB_25865 [Candidatus Rokuibacteriota bacterium]
MIGRPLYVATLAGLAVLAAAEHRADAYHESAVHLEPRLWFPSLSAEVQSSSDAVAGDVITDTDLDLDDPVSPGGVVTLRVGRHSLRVEGFGLSTDGDTRIDRTFSFAGRTYTVNSRVESEFDATVAGADYGFDVVQTGPLALGLTLGARVVDAEARLRAPELGFDSESEVRAVVPAVGAFLVAHPAPVPPFSSLALTLRVSGFTIGDRGEYLDVEGAAEWLPIPVLALRVGYRFVHGKGEEDDDRGEFDLAGPYVGLTLAF